MKRTIKSLLVLLVVAVGLIGVAAPGAEPPLQPIAHGVTVGRLEVGGNSSERARARITRSFSHALEIKIGDRSWHASPGWLGARVAVDDAVARALHAQPGERVKIRVDVTGDAIPAYVDKLAKQVYVPPTDAKLLGIEGVRPNIQGGKAGRELDRVAALHAIRWELRNGNRNPMKLRMRRIQPKTLKKDLGPLIVVERGSNKLLLYNGDTLVRTLGVATGQAIYPTPLGDWHIVTMQENPWWIPPDSPWAKGAKPIPPGPGNPLGTRWMGLDAAGVGIHGTPDAASIGYSASHGCIRMRIPDAEWLFTQVNVGTPVYIVSA